MKREVCYEVIVAGGGTAGARSVFFAQVSELKASEFTSQE